jgi:hypothetical protein
MIFKFLACLAQEKNEYRVYPDFFEKACSKSRIKFLCTFKAGFGTIFRITGGYVITQATIRKPEHAL